MAKKNQLEIERKFLLKRLPEKAEKKGVVAKSITQLYFVDAQNVGKRIRKTQIGTIVEYDLNQKTFIKKGVYDEKEEPIDRDKYKTLKKLCTSRIRKIRYLIPDGELTWEIDLFVDMDLVVAEVELPKEQYALKIPKFIQDVLIMEVTPYKNFTNKALADPL